MKFTKENIQLMDTIRHLCSYFELSENKDYYFISCIDVEAFNIQTVVDNAEYYKTSVFYSYSYELENKILILTFKKIND